MNQPLYPPQPGYPAAPYAQPQGAPPGPGYPGQPPQQPGYPAAAPPQQPPASPYALAPGAPYQGQPPAQGYAPQQQAPQGFPPQPGYPAQPQAWGQPQQPPQGAPGYPAAPYQPPQPQPGYPAGPAPAYNPQGAASLFAGADGIDADARTPKVTPGGYRFRIDGCSVSQGHNGAYFVIELTVLESIDSASILHGHATKKPGEKVSWSRKIEGQYRNSGIADVKSACMATMGVDPKEPSQQANYGQAFFAQAITPQSPMIGRTVKATVWYPEKTIEQIQKEPTRSPFIKANWTPDDGRPLAPANAGQAMGERILQGAPAQLPPAMPAAAPAGYVAPQPFPPAPWVVHPNDAAYVWNQQTNDVITVDALRARMGV